MKYLLIIITTLALGIATTNAQGTGYFLKAMCREAIKSVSRPEELHSPKTSEAYDSCIQKGIDRMKKAIIHERMMTLAETDTFRIICNAVSEKKKSEIKLMEKDWEQYEKCIYYFSHLINCSPNNCKDYLIKAGLPEQTVNALSKIAAGRRFPKKK